MFIIITAIVSVMVVLALALTWVDSKMLNQINDYKAAGLTDLPSNNANPEELLGFANEVGIECVSIESLFSGNGACGDVLEVARTVNDYKSEHSIIWAFIVISGITLVVTFTMFIHNASSNLEHLRIAGQKFTPGWSVGWFFVPFMNLYKPTRVVRELSTASGSTDTLNPRAWQNAESQEGMFISSWWTLVIFAERDLPFRRT